eukprot:TRINITY_DN41304_c0_g1_i1.p3 TRINITY_DN41304_c0_g1~~TRINITY_DN41304_c0_g1_i1.p3  ORF type:complete len:137 (-),score=9.08 TRINITY_DN41304_c0_g1_i1:12-422(-)
MLDLRPAAGVPYCWHPFPLRPETPSRNRSFPAWEPSCTQEESACLASTFDRTKDVRTARHVRFAITTTTSSLRDNCSGTFVNMSGSPEVVLMPWQCAYQCDQQRLECAAGCSDAKRWKYDNAALVQTDVWAGNRWK